MGCGQLRIRSTRFNGGPARRAGERAGDDQVHAMAVTTNSEYL
jgi:hypothetical protein